RDDEGVVMAIEHDTCPWAGVQFHPESVMTPSGLDMMVHFLNSPRHD
ncbi:MAG: anthranilate/aminodeoxychorismate synthase component II, partial [Bacteroidota bacterium]|nr:anthranilate/aminodeoxychorismate synthase component II [Bacteroidota bacterium]